MPLVPRELEITYGSIQVSDVELGNGVYNIAATAVSAWVTVGTYIRVYGSAFAANNGIFRVTAVTPTKITTDNSSSVLEGVSTARFGFVIGGTLPAGGDSIRRFPDSLVTFEKSQDTTGVLFSFSIQQDDEDDFIADANSVETAFKVPYQRLEIRQNGKVILNLDPGTGVNTGFNAAPQIVKREDDVAANTGRSRRYHVRIDFDLPADLYDQSGRRNSSVMVQFTPNDKRTAVFVGEWTASGASDSARGNYTANIGGYTAGVLSGFGGTWEKVDEDVEADETDKVVTFRRVHEEIISDQSSVGLDDDEIIQHEVFISRKKPAPGDTPKSVRRFGEINASYSAWIKKGVNPRTKYTSGLRNFLITRALQKFDASAGALVDENVEVDEPNNRLQVALTLLARIDNSARVQFKETSEVNLDFGEVLYPAWTGDPLSHYRFKGHVKYIKTVTSEERLLSGAAPAGGAGGGGGGGGAVGGFFAFPGGQVAGGGGGAGGLAAAFGFGQSGSSGGSFSIPPDPPSIPPGGNQGQQGEQGQQQDSPIEFVGLGEIKDVLLTQSTADTPIRLGSPSHHINVIDRRTVRVFQRIRQIPVPTNAVATQSAFGNTPQPGGPDGGN